MKDEKLGKGGLIVNLTDLNYVRVGDVDIYFHGIKTSGQNGGRTEIKLRMVGPRTTPIRRLPR